MILLLTLNGHLSSPEAYLEPCQKSKMERFMKIFNVFQPLTIFAKCSILDVSLDPDYVALLGTLLMTDASNSKYMYVF